MPTPKHLHALMFCSPATDWEAGAGARTLDAPSSRAAVDGLQPGDVVWLVTRMPGERQTPALCGRLVTDRVEDHEPGSASMEAVRQGCVRRLVGDRIRSERCEPFACPMIAHWEVWRHAFTELEFLSPEQAESLEAFWDAAACLRERV